MKNFTKTLVLQADEATSYNGLTQAIPEWWTEMFDGSACQVGKQFTIRFGEAVFKTMLVEELRENEKVVWQVVDALIDLPELVHKDEWINTRIVWSISGSASGTIVKLTHFGLTRQVECYDICASGWEGFLRSFERFVTTGAGEPFRIADAS